MLTKIEIRKDRKDKDGLCPLYLKALAGGTRKRLILPVSGDPEYWDSVHGVFYIEKGRKEVEAKERNQRHKQINAYLEEQRTRINDILRDFERANINPTATQFIDKFCLNDSKYPVSKFWEQHIQSLKETGHIGNAACYENTLHIARLFDKKFDSLFFQDIDIRYIKRFDDFLQKPRETKIKLKGGNIKTKERLGAKGNTRKYYHKAFRALLNLAIQEGVGSPDTYPYGKNGFDIGSLEEETTKRYLPVETMQRIKATQMDNYVLEVTRRLFVTMYYMYGISFVDAALLTEENICKLNGGEYIIYKRQKTQHAKKVKPITIKIAEDLRQHLDWFSANTNLIGNSLLPIVSKEGLSGEKLYDHIRSRFVTNNKHLKKLGVAFHVEKTLTSYVSRHTMAMTLQENDIPREIISQLLGHSDIKITKTYLDSFDSKVIDEAAKVL